MTTMTATTRVLIITLQETLPDGQDGGKARSDKYGALVKDLVVKHAPTWHIENAIVPNIATTLTAKLKSAINDNVDVIFTVGGTGVGRTDIAPETVTAVCSKLIPGIMENIRVKYGARKPAALLSRSVAGIAENTQIYTLPASSRAIEEYCHEILQVVEIVKKWLD